MSSTTNGAHESEAVSDRQIDINIRGVITGTKLAELMGGPAAPVMTMPA
jgi:hypothetical protein